MDFEENKENEVADTADAENVTGEDVEVKKDDFSFFFSILDENSEDYEWAMSQMKNTVPVNDIVENYDARESARKIAEAEAAEAEKAEKARIEAEEKARLEAEAIAAQEAETTEQAEEAHIEEETTPPAEEVVIFDDGDVETVITSKEEPVAPPITPSPDFADNMISYVNAKLGVAENETTITAPEENKTEAQPLDDGEDDIEEIVEQEPKRDKKTMDDKLERLKAAVEGNFGHGTGGDTTSKVFEENDARDNAAFMGLPRRPICLATVLLFAFDMLIVNIASYKVIYFLIEKILLSSGVEALHLSNESFSNILVGVSYVASLILGGLVVLITAKLAEYIIHGLGFSNGKKITLGIVGIFAAVFLIGALIASLVEGSLLTVGVYRWAGPLLTYAGGMVLIAASKVNVSIDY